MEEYFAKDVLEGLGSSPKRLPSKYFYDAEGDHLFMKIMELPEYYLTDCELEIFTEKARDLIQAFNTKNRSFDLFELGAGDGSKTIELLRKLDPGLFRYVPVDISENALQILSERMSSELPELTIEPIQGEYFDALEAIQSPVKKIILFLGSNIGNLNDDEARSFICTLASKMRKGDMFLLGVDLIKSRTIILPAYDDTSGVTSAFNLNLLTRINRELGGNFQLDNFEHAPEYNEVQGVAISYIQSICDQKVYIKDLDLEVEFVKDEKIHTEISRKYDLEIIKYITRGSGLEIKELFHDSREYFCDVLFEKIV